MQYLKLILIRHGEKAIGSSEDPGLTLRGHEQSENLLKLVWNKTLPQPTHLLSSPKLRAQQTLQPLSKAYFIDLTRDPLLDQRDDPESKTDFLQRIQKFENKYCLTFPSLLPPVLYACSHIDWIQGFHDHLSRLSLVDSFFDYCPPGHYDYFEFQDSIWRRIKSGVVPMGGLL